MDLRAWRRFSPPSSVKASFVELDLGKLELISYLVTEPKRHVRRRDGIVQVNLNLLASVIKFEFHLSRFREADAVAIRFYNFVVLQISKRARLRTVIDEDVCRVPIR